MKANSNNSPPHSNAPENVLSPSKLQLPSQQQQAVSLNNVIK